MRISVFILIAAVFGFASCAHSSSSEPSAVPPSAPASQQIVTFELARVP